MTAIELKPIFRERIWGRTSLEPYFSDIPNTDRIGEAWYTFTENPTSAGKTFGELLSANPELLGSGVDEAYPGICPILVKLLFTTERLSVQVHPDDNYARQHHDSLGKTEAWYVIESAPPGEVAVGFREELSRERFATAARTGEIEHLLDWRKVHAGDVIFIPAGTVHAIGAGLTICEVQETSDITYRLYDYGRPRELHLDHGAAVARLGPDTRASRPRRLAPGRDELVSCEYFRMEKLVPNSGFGIEGDLPTYVVLVCTRGEGKMLNGGQVRAGQAWFVPASKDSNVQISGPGAEWIAAYRHPSPLAAIAVR